MRIPEIQARLRELAVAHHISELSALADELSRRSPKRRAPVSSEPMTDQLRSEIRRLHAADPDLPVARIAVALNINPGRVSETLRGFRK